MASPDALAPLAPHDPPAGDADRVGMLGFLAGILEALPNPVFVKDERHRWVLVNERFCRIIGHERADLIGRSDDDFFPLGEAQEFWRKDDVVFASGQVNENEESFTDHDRQRHHILTRKTLHVDPTGRRFLVGVITDISERKAMEEALVRTRGELEHRVDDRTAELSLANEALRQEGLHKNEFLAMLSHELRNPLAPIRNALWLLDRAPVGGEQAVRARETINRQVLHLTRLVDDLLDVTRISQGKIHLQRSRVDLAEVVRRTVEDHRPLFVAGELSLELDAGPIPLRVSADPTRIAQVVGNLLANAAKFTHPRGRVEVVLTREAGGYATLRIKDDGVGFPPEIGDRLFQPFIQADATLHRTRGGLGLGLALVKGLVELHGGEVWARSEGAERGAEFGLRLPLDAEEPALNSAPRPAPAQMSRRRVLVVEDNPDAAETLREMLLIWEHDVEIARDGRAGLECVRTFQPDVVLCDVGLPELDGYGVARAIRADPALAGTYLVAVTGYASPEDQRRAADAGFDRHLAKPVPVDVIEEVLATAPRRPRPPGAA
jgi:PAS domain S-box-containing protein